MGSTPVPLAIDPAHRPQDCRYGHHLPTSKVPMACSVPRLMSYPLGLVTVSLTLSAVNAIQEITRMNLLEKGETNLTLQLHLVCIHPVVSLPLCM